MRAYSSHGPHAALKDPAYWNALVGWEDHLVIHSHLSQLKRMDAGKSGNSEPRLGLINPARRKSIAPRDYPPRPASPSRDERIKTEFLWNKTASCGIAAEKKKNRRDIFVTAMKCGDFDLPGLLLTKGLVGQRPPPEPRMQSTVTAEQSNETAGLKFHLDGMLPNG